MGWWDRWLDKRERRRKAKRKQIAHRVADRNNQLRIDEELDKVNRAISDEVDRQLTAVGEWTPMTAMQVRFEADGKVAETRLNMYRSDRLDPLLVPTAVQQLVSDVIDARHKRTERRHGWKQQLERSLRETEEDTVRRERATKAAPGLLAGAGISAGPDELKIATMLLMHHENATTQQLQQALETFKDAYERRVQRYKDTGGQSAWPTADVLIQLLFGRP